MKDLLRETERERERERERELDRGPLDRFNNNNTDHHQSCFRHALHPDLVS